MLLLAGIVFVLPVLFSSLRPFSYEYFFLAFEGWVGSFLALFKADSFVHFFLIYFDILLSILGNLINFIHQNVI